MARPRIGICTNLEVVRYGLWSEVAAFVPFDYIASVQRAGGVALLLAPDGALAEGPAEVLDLLDGLVLAGGSDVDPASYGADRHPETSGDVPERDAFEVAMARAASERDMPLLGICRGMQILNIARGGTLLQHLPDAVGSDEHRRNVGTFGGNGHDVLLQKGSLAAHAAGEERHATLSHHHQAVDRLGDGLMVTGRAVGDELIEAVEDPERRFVLGVQWHPEADETSRVIGALVEEARAYRSTRTRSATGIDGEGAEAGTSAR
jgi:putative glutamine amidotransferase